MLEKFRKFRSKLYAFLRGMPEKSVTDIVLDVGSFVKTSLETLRRTLKPPVIQLCFDPDVR